MHHGSVVDRRRIGTVEHRLLIERETGLHRRRHGKVRRFDRYSAWQSYCRGNNAVFGRRCPAFVEAAVVERVGPHTGRRHREGAVVARALGRRTRECLTGWGRDRRAIAREGWVVPVERWPRPAN